MPDINRIFEFHTQSRVALDVVERRPLPVKPGESYQEGNIGDLSISRDKYSVRAILTQYTGPNDGLTADRVSFLTKRKHGPNPQLQEVLVTKKDAELLGNNVIVAVTYGPMQAAAERVARAEIGGLELPAPLDELIIFQMRFVINPAGMITKSVVAQWSENGETNPAFKTDRPVSGNNITLIANALTVFRRKLATRR